MSSVILVTFDLRERRSRPDVTASNSLSRYALEVLGNLPAGHIRVADDDAASPRVGIVHVTVRRPKYFSCAVCELDCDAVPMPINCRNNAIVGSCTVSADCIDRIG